LISSTYSFPTHAGFSFVSRLCIPFNSGVTGTETTEKEPLRKPD
jgi:hypothetical protein